MLSQKSKIYQIVFFETFSTINRETFKILQYDI